MGVSAPSLHRESTDSLIWKEIEKTYTYVQLQGSRVWQVNGADGCNYHTLLIHTYLKSITLTLYQKVSDIVIPPFGSDSIKCHLSDVESR